MPKVNIVKCKLKNVRTKLTGTTCIYYINQVELLTAVLAAIRLDNKLENRFYTWLFGPTIEEEELEGQEDFHRTLSR